MSQSAVRRSGLISAGTDQRTAWARRFRPLQSAGLAAAVLIVQIETVDGRHFLAALGFRRFAFQEIPAGIAVDGGSRALRPEESLRGFASPAGAVRAAGVQSPVKRGQEVGRAVISAAPPASGRGGPAEAGALQERADVFA